MGFEWAHAGSSAIAAFLASLVEFVEALTIVLAVGTTRGWRPAFVGTGLGILLLVVLVSIFGPALQMIPIHYLQLAIGILLLLFGMRWLRKAILRQAGIIALHDEEKIFRDETEFLRKIKKTNHGLFKDPIAVATSFKAVVLEGVEVVFIVIATGSGSGNLIPASLGAGVAFILVVALGFAIHKPLSRVPENQLKFAVGLLLSSFGLFWVGEGLNYPWPGEDFSIIGLTVLLFAVSFVAIRMARLAAAGEKV